MRNRPIAPSPGSAPKRRPPPLPEYDQPPIPAPGYIWTPGYWAWNNVDYYWVPGSWAEPPEAELLWTPPYWGFANGAYVFHRGYWGERVGFYGGVDYGYGYGGRGFEGGRWDHGAFYYNRAVTNLRGATITNVYEKNVVISNRDRVSYNGGRGGLTLRPTAEEEARGARAASAADAVADPACPRRQRGQHRFRLDQSRPSGPRGRRRGLSAWRASRAMKALRARRRLLPERRGIRHMNCTGRSRARTIRRSTTGWSRERIICPPKAGKPLREKRSSIGSRPRPLAATIRMCTSASNRVPARCAWRLLRYIARRRIMKRRPVLKRRHIARIPRA